MKPLPWLCFTVALITAGCPSSEYTIAMKPVGDGLERSLTCWREDGSGASRHRVDFPTDEADAIAARYSFHEFIEGAKEHRFRGTFRGTLPDDVGGAGSFTNSTSPLGDAFFYVERFRGEDDLAARLERRHLAANQLTDLLIGWAAAELGNDPRAEKLTGFLTGQLRQDLKSLSLYAWQTETAARFKTGVEEEFTVRIGQFLHERGYFKLTELPVLLNAEHADEKQLLQLVQRLVARRMGVPDSEPIPASLAFLGDKARLAASWEKYCRTTDLFNAKSHEHHQQKGGEASDLTVSDFTGDLISSIVEFQLFAAHDRLSVTLTLPAAPDFTNGAWDPKASVVRWQQGIEQDDPRELSALCYATWTRPSEAFQKERFGKLALTGKALVAYNTWRASLTPARVEEWDALIASLKPGAELISKLESFRFTDEPRRDDAKALADPARALILEGLK
ncbi:MAG: hypothetical protein AB1705_21330 [Verrucomicrobiota bacterium]